MKKKIFSITLALALLCALVLPALPVQAAGPPDIPPGQLERLEHGWKRLNPNTKVHQTGTEIIGGKKYATVEAIIDSLPTTLDDNRTLIDTNWYLQTDISGQTWFQNGLNTFTARVLDGRVSVEDENGHLRVWNPTVVIGNDSFSGGRAVIVDDPINENYKGNTLKWEYGNYSTGWFSSSVLTRYLRNIEGVVSEMWVLPGDPKANVSIRLNELEEFSVSGYAVWLQAYDANYEFLRVTKNKFGVYVINASEFKNKEFPITIDPTMNFVGHFYDGELSYAESTYNAARTSTWGHVRDSNIGSIGQVEYGYYNVSRFVLMFATGGLPDDAVISTSSLYLYGYGDGSDTDFYITVQSGMPTYPHMPPTNSDYDHVHYSGNGGTLHTGGFSTSTYNLLYLNSTGRGWINKTGWTKFILRSDQDISGSAPVGYEFVTIREYSYGSDYAPKLRVIYSEPIEPPTVTTRNATNVASNQATLEGYLDDDGGEPCSVRFGLALYNQSYQYYPWEGGYTTGRDFDLPVYGLSPGKTYCSKAEAMNSAPGGTVSSSWKGFITLPHKPVEIDAAPGDGTVALVWIKGSGAQKTMIRRSTTSHPSSITDGTQIYFDTGTNHDDNTVVNDTEYFYSAWSYAIEYGYDDYSASYVSDSTTPSGPSVGEVTTLDASVVGVSTATLNLNVDDLGGSAHVHVQFQYYHGAGDWEDNETALSGEEGLGLYDDDIDTLEADTLYHVRAVIINDTDTGYGLDVPFTTGAVCAPTITTQSATVLQLRSAILNGIVTDDGGEPCIVWFRWGKTTDYEEGPTEHSTTYYPTDGEFSIGLSGLEPSTTYHYQAIGENVEGGIGYGADVSFITTTPTAPTIRTDGASDIGANQAQLNSTMLTDGGVECEVQFQWGTTDAYGADTGWVEGYTKDQTFNRLITGLTIGETYHFRAQAKNAGGTGSGDDVTFTTVFGAPENFRAKAISSTTINLSWGKQGDQTYIRYKATGFPIDHLDGDPVYMGPDEFTSISGLKAGTTYYFRAWSWREGDVWAEDYADDVATTQATLPVDEEERPEVLEEPPMPESWFQDPIDDNAALTKMPFYNNIVDFAKAYEIPEGSMWLTITIVLTIVAAALAFTTVHNAFVAIAVGGGVIVGCCALGMAPLWFMIVYVALGGGMIYVTSKM